MHVDAEMVNHYAPDTGACVRAILALLAIPTKEERHPRLATVKGSALGPVKTMSPGAHSIQRRRARVKAAHYAESLP
jgi:hypothetical protein